MNMTKKLISILFSLLLAISSVYAAESGVTPTKILIGTSYAFNNPIGVSLLNGANSYVNKINRTGGVHGRTIRFVYYDDNNEPKKAKTNTIRLITQDDVFLLFSYVGTQTSKAAIPLLSRVKVPYIAPLSGAEFLRNPVNEYVFNLRGGYFNEIESQVEYLINKRNFKKIGIFFQNNDDGLSVKTGLARTLHKRKLTISGEGKYAPNTLNVDSALSSLKNDNPEAVIIFGNYKTSAALINKAKENDFNPVFFVFSFIDTKAFINALGNNTKDVLISQVTPSPYDSSINIIKAYQKEMKASEHYSFDYASLEGFLNAVVLVKGLKEAGKNLTRKSFIKAINSINEDIGGLNINYTKLNHQALNKIYLTKIKNGNIIPIQ